MVRYKEFGELSLQDIPRKSDSLEAKCKEMRAAQDFCTDRLTTETMLAVVSL